ncbi:MAG: helix-turn-helix transcriptional regulator, partial [Firmicutes bacterium]|nr:helix-turn-helix transcriptional regulator [Bacillota bacterium]
MNIGEKIRAIREKEGFSLGELANMTGINKSTLHRYETGKTAKIPPEAINIVEKSLNLPIGYLSGNDYRLKAIVESVYSDNPSIKASDFDFRSITNEKTEHINNLFEKYDVLDFAVNIIGYPQDLNHYKKIITNEINNLHNAFNM